MEPFFNFTIFQLLIHNHLFGILSLYSDKILIGDYSLSKLFVYSRDKRHLLTIDCEQPLSDAQWTPHGNIVYITTSRILKVVKESNEVIATHTHIKKPFSLSVSADKIIYLTDWETGVYQSTDDGISWDLVFLNSIDGWHFWRVIKATVDHIDSFWTLNCQSIIYCHLQVYKKRPDGLWVSANFTNLKGMHLILTTHDYLSYDGRISFLVSNWNKNAIDILSVNDNCHLWSSYFMYFPQRLVVDMERNLAYVGSKRALYVFKLKYEKVCS